MAMSSPSEETAAWAKVRQLTQRVANLEVDLAQVSARKQELERQNEELAAQVGGPQMTPGPSDREMELERDLSAARAEIAGLKEEKNRVELHTQARDRQQADVASSFAELQRVVAQLVQQLNVLDGERGRLSKEKHAVERAHARLRHDVRQGTAGRAAACSCGKVQGCPVCRLRCRAEDKGLAALMPGKARDGARHAEVVKLRSQLQAAEAACARETALREEVSLQRAALGVEESLAQRHTDVLQQSATNGKSPYMRYCRPRDSVSLASLKGNTASTPDKSRDSSPEKKQGESSLEGDSSPEGQVPTDDSTSTPLPPPSIADAERKVASWPVPVTN